MGESKLGGGRSPRVGFVRLRLGGGLMVIGNGRDHTRSPGSEWLRGGVQRTERPWC